MQRKISSIMQGGREKRAGQFGNFWVLEFLVKRLSRIRRESVFEYLFLKGWSIVAGVVADSSFHLIRGCSLLVHLTRRTTSLLHLEEQKISREIHMVVGPITLTFHFFGKRRFKQSTCKTFSIFQKYDDILRWDMSLIFKLLQFGSDKSKTHLN